VRRSFGDSWRFVGSCGPWGKGNGEENMLTAVAKGAHKNLQGTNSFLSLL
jgi:hypothetical protein